MGEEVRRTMEEIELHTSERSTFRRCPQRWWWQYRDGLIPREPTIDALWFGIGIHVALAKWYKKGKRRGPHPADTWLDYCKDEEREIRANYTGEWYDEPKYVDARLLGEEMLVAYIEKFGNDPQWNVIAIEQPFRVDITREGQKIANFGSTFDGIVRHEGDGRLYLLEHKTAAQIQTAHLALDDQAGSYWAIAGPLFRQNGLLKKDEELAGIIYNILRKAQPDPRPVNEDGESLNQNGTVSKRQPTPLFHREYVERGRPERVTQLNRMADELTVMNAMRDGTIPVFKNTTAFPSCTGCQFFTMCTLHERGGDAWRTLRDTEYVRRDPYQDRRKSA